LILHLSGKNIVRDTWEAMNSLIQSKKKKSKNGVEREAQRHKDDRIRHGDNLSHQNPICSRSTGCSWGDSGRFIVGEDDTKRLHKTMDIVHKRDRGT
jgi:hypothetical protein